MAAEAPVFVDSVKRVGALPVIKSFCDRLDVAGIVNELLPLAPQALAGRGETLVALIMNKLTAPSPLYRIEEWADQSGAEPLLGIHPALMTDDRIGRLLDDVADNVEAIKRALCLQAIEKFGLDVGRLHWDLTSVEFMGDYDAQHPLWPLITYGYSPRGIGESKQVRVANLTLGDGAVGGLLHKTYPGNTGDTNTVTDYIPLFCEIRDRFGKNPRLVGDSKLLSQQHMATLEDARLQWLCPEPHTAVLDREYLDLPYGKWTKIDYLKSKDKDLPVPQQPSYLVQEVPFDLEIRQKVVFGAGLANARPAKVIKAYKFRRRLTGPEYSVSLEPEVHDSANFPLPEWGSRKSQGAGCEHSATALTSGM